MVYQQATVATQAAFATQIDIVPGKANQAPAMLTALSTSTNMLKQSCAETSNASSQQVDNAFGSITISPTVIPVKVM